MTTLYLKAASKKAMQSLVSKALPGFAGTDADGKEYLVCYTHQWAVDWDVRDPSPKSTESGFFANVRVLDPAINASALNAKDRKPANPWRDFG